jgi:hypothetical protein
MGSGDDETLRIGGLALGFLATVRSGDLYAHPHVVEMPERVLEALRR